MDETSPLWAPLPPAYYEADVINVLGGGPSVRDYDLSQLDGITIGACRAGLLVQAEITLSCDGRFTKQCPREIAQALDAGRNVIHPVTSLVKAKQVAHMDPRIRLIGWRRGGFSSDPRYVYGLDSGFACFNAAAIYRPRLIRLLGLDYAAPDKKAPRFHDGYPGTAPGAYDRSLFSWAKQYETHKTRIREVLGSTQVVNYVGDPESRIELFPVRALDDLLPKKETAA